MLRLPKRKEINYNLIYFIIAINISVFLYVNEMVSKEITDYYNVYFSLNSLTISSPLNWITNGFMHANYVHLGMNMFFFYILSTQLLEKINNIKLISIYFLSMLGSSFAAYLYINNTTEVINVLGASGAIFGVFSYLMLKLNQVKSLIIQIFVFHAIIITMNMPIAWYGHLGGVLTGVILYFITEKKK